jgi:hypothetical protein
MCVKVVIPVIIHVLFIFELTGGNDNLNLTTEDQVEAITPGGLLETRDTRSLAPFI